MCELFHEMFLARAGTTARPSQYLCTQGQGPGGSGRQLSKPEGRAYASQPCGPFRWSLLALHQTEDASILWGTALTRRF